MSKWTNDMSENEFREYFKEVITERESQVLECLVNNYNCVEIANHLGTNKATIICHVNNLFQKLQCNDRKSSTELLLKNKMYVYKRNY